MHLIKIVNIKTTDNCKCWEEEERLAPSPSAAEGINRHSQSVEQAGSLLHLVFPF